MKELNTFRQFMEGKGSTVKLNKSDMDKLHKDGKIEKNDHTIEFGEGMGSTFQITPEYLFDAAIKYIQDDYDGASLHVAPDGTTDDFYDGDKHTFTIKSKEQAEDIIDNFEAQMVKTAQNDWADEQDAMYGKASFVEEEDLSENDKTLDELLNEE